MISADSRTQPHDQRGGSGLAGLARGGVASLAGAAVAGTAGLGVAWLVAHGLGPAAAGVFFAATAGFTLLVGLARLGTPTGMVYWVAWLRVRGRPDLAAACVRAGLPPVAVTATGLAVGLWVAAPWLAEALAAGEAPVAATTAVLRVLAPFLPLAALAEAVLAATRGYRLIRPTVVLDKLLRPVLQLAGLASLALAALWMVTPPAGWALLWVLPYLPVTVLAGYALHRIQPPEPAGAGAGQRRPSMAKPFWRFTAPRAVASVLQLALQRLDIILVAVIAGPVPAAIYTVAGRFVLLGQLANQAIANPVQPRLAERLGAGDRAGTGLLYRTATAWLVLVTWPLYLLVAVYAVRYLGLFGPDYTAGAPVVVVLAAAMLVATGCGAVDMLLAMAGRTSWNLGNVSLALATMVALDLILIPPLGILGAAIGLAVAVVVNNLLPLAQVIGTLGLHPFGAGTLTAIALATGCFGVVPLGSAALLGSGPAALAGTLAGSLALYAAGLRRFRRPLALAVLAAAWARSRAGGSHAQ